MFSWIKGILLSNYLGSAIRHVLTGVGGFLIAKNLANAQQAQSLTDSLMAVLPGIASYLLGQGASLVAKGQP